MHLLLVYLPHSKIQKIKKRQYITITIPNRRVLNNNGNFKIDQENKIMRLDMANILAKYCPTTIQSTLFYATAMKIIIIKIIIIKIIIIKIIIIKIIIKPNN